MIDLAEVGAFVLAVTNAGIQVRFGIYLPGIDANTFSVKVLVIHEEDRFTDGIEPQQWKLTPVPGHPTALWQAALTIAPQPGTSFGKPGRYLYRYQLLRSGNLAGQDAVVLRWFTDPFARATDDVGELSAFSTPQPSDAFVWTDDGWKVPVIDDLVVYELHVEEFNDTFAGVGSRLDYLLSLGVNCLELMPVTSLKLDFDWGYGPLHYLAPNERWGGALGLKRLIDACHGRGIAVILDVVYQHVDELFPYAVVYTRAGLPSPMIDGKGDYGPKIDYDQEFARQYVATANRYWLREYHADGFRYDEVKDYYFSPTDQAYARLAYETYNESLRIGRFTPSGTGAAGEFSCLIQCAEALDKAKDVLANTYSNAAWTDELLWKAWDMAWTGTCDNDFAHRLDLSYSGYPASKQLDDGVDLPQVAFQYIESHDHSPLIAQVSRQTWPTVFADRSRWYKLQPFVIALYTAQGVPMLWQGQEFADNNVLPSAGDGRIHYRRNVHWEYFYDDFGAPLVRLYRRMGYLRRTIPALRSRESYYYNADSRSEEGLLAYHRQLASAGQIAMVLLNFSDQDAKLDVPFPKVGRYREMVNDKNSQHWDIAVGQDGERKSIPVPSNYGLVFVSPVPA